VTRVYSGGASRLIALRHTPERMSLGQGFGFGRPVASRRQLEQRRTCQHQQADLSRNAGKPAAQARPTAANATIDAPAGSG